MARSNSKGKKNSKSEKSTYKIRFPQQLTQLAALKSNYIRVVSCMSNFGKVKLWVPPSPCNTISPWPQLMLLFNSSTEPSSHFDTRQQPNGSANWSIFKYKKCNTKCCTTYPVSPFGASTSFSTYRISKPVEVMLTYDSSPALMVYCFNELDQRAWIRHDCTLIDPFDAKRRRMHLTRIITAGDDDKIYAFSLQGTLVVMENVDSRLMITRISSSRGVPSVSSRYFKEYFVKFVNGDILLVFLIYKRSLEVVDQVEVFRLCCDKLKWIKVERRLHGKALFLDWNGNWVNSEEVGCSKNCVYFTQGSDNGWWVFDMETCCISPIVARIFNPRSANHSKKKYK